MGGLALQIRDLDFEATVELGGPTLHLSGNADGAIVASLSALIIDLHQALIDAKAVAIQIDLRRLEFMNASCFNVFVNWLGAITELPVAQRYRLDFAANPAIPWQQRSLETLRCFATDLVGWKA